MINLLVILIRAHLKSNEKNHRVLVDYAPSLEIL